MENKSPPIIVLQTQGLSPENTGSKGPVRGIQQRAVTHRLGQSD